MSPEDFYSSWYQRGGDHAIWAMIAMSAAGRTSQGNTPARQGTASQAAKNSRLTPNELKNLGTRGNSPYIRNVQGGVQDAKNLFNRQVDLTTVREAQPGVFVGRGFDGYIYTFRPVSSNLSQNVPTIDVKGISGIKKIKFVP